MTCGKKYLRDGIRLKKEGLLAVYKHVKRSELLLCFLRTYELLSVRRVEKKGDPLKGDRYLLELVVKYLPNGANYILAEYVFQPKDLSGPLCYPSGLQWDRTADVYLILTAKNLGRWVHHFIKNVEQIVKEWGSTTSTTLGPSFSISMSMAMSTLPSNWLVRKILRSQVTGMHYIPRILNLDATTASSAQSFFNSM